MALTTTKYHDALRFKVIGDDAIVADDLAINVAGGPGKLFFVRVDNTKSAGAAVYAKIYFSEAPVLGTTYPDLVLKVESAASQTFQIPYGYDFTELSFGCTLNPTPLDTTNPAASTSVTLTCS